MMRVVASAICTSMLVLERKRCTARSVDGNSGNCTKYSTRVQRAATERVTVHQEPTINCKTHVVCRACPRRPQPIKAATALRIRKSSQHSGRGTWRAPLKIKLKPYLNLPVRADSTRPMSSLLSEVEFETESAGRQVGTRMLPLAYLE